MRDRSPIQSAALLVGLVFLLVGIAGFIPGITTDYDDLVRRSRLQGPAPRAVRGLGPAQHRAPALRHRRTCAGDVGRRPHVPGRAAASSTCVLFVYGLSSRHSGANFVPVNCADNVLHLGLGLGMITLGAVLGKDVVRRSSTAPAV